LTGVNILRHLPDLKNVVICNTRDNPIFMRIPREVGQFIGVTTVDEQQLRRAILSVLSFLLLPNLG